MITAGNFSLIIFVTRRRFVTLALVQVHAANPFLTHSSTMASRHVLLSNLTTILSRFQATRPEHRCLYLAVRALQGTGGCTHATGSLRHIHRRTVATAAHSHAIVCSSAAEAASSELTVAQLQSRASHSRLVLANTCRKLRHVSMRT